MEIGTSKGQVNTLECSSLVGGIGYTFVDTKGRRLEYKGGPQSGNWTGRGKASLWVQY